MFEELKVRSIRHGQRVTALRRQVPGLLRNRGGHASAYELINDLPSIGRRPSPPPVYRTLEYLMEIGMVKRLSATNTFVVPPPCITGSTHTVFLICTHCGAVEALENLELERALSAAANGAGYDVTGEHTEVNGICRGCRSWSAKK
ncbi:transcriptional repressor [Caballeronia sp. INDeC2]|uniref:Fur family transcriptional regulator n=1 Tax=Caballeronia sp. INDeC2 TaxID=2921747 RepID=UPI002027DFE3